MTQAIERQGSRQQAIQPIEVEGDEDNIADVDMDTEPEPAN